MCTEFLFVHSTSSSKTSFCLKYLSSSNQKRKLLIITKLLVQYYKQVKTNYWKKHAKIVQNDSYSIFCIEKNPLFKFMSFTIYLFFYCSILGKIESYRLVCMCKSASLYMQCIISTAVVFCCFSNSKKYFCKGIASIEYL